jgi:hypothetical protein
MPPPQTSVIGQQTGLDLAKRCLLCEASPPPPRPVYGPSDQRKRGKLLASTMPPVKVDGVCRLRDSLHDGQGCHVREGKTYPLPQHEKCMYLKYG